jgi:hypothetical protein
MEQDSLQYQEILKPQDADRFTELQRQRYSVGGKGGDGDPPYARDISLMTAKYGRSSLCIVDDNGAMRYRDS